MQTIETLFQRELRKLIALRIADHKETLAMNNFETVEQFRFVMGKISALTELEDMMDSAATAAEQRNR